MDTYYLSPHLNIILVLYPLLARRGSSAAEPGSSEAVGCPLSLAGLEVAQGSSGEESWLRLLYCTAAPFFFFFFPREKHDRLCMNRMLTAWFCLFMWEALCANPAVPSGPY